MTQAAGALLAQIQACWPDTPPVTGVVVGFSGGLDSTVLLHALVKSFGPQAILAAHIHHGLLDQADQWLCETRAVARRLGCRFESVTLQKPGSHPEGGIEQWARNARREALLKICAAHQIDQLALAHHADDQIETVLLNLGRGAGPAGMRGMPARSQLGTVELVRPLLTAGREQLLDYANAEYLTWIEDPSNRDQTFRRNRVRHQLVPLLVDIFPGFRGNLLRHASIAGDLHDSFAIQLPGPHPHRFDRRDYLHLQDPQLDHFLHAWLRGAGCRPPSRARTVHMRNQLFHASGAYAQISHDGRVLRRYRDQVALTGELPSLPEPLSLRWQGERRLALPGFGGELTFDPAGEGESGVSGRWLRQQSLQIGPLQMKARLRPAPGHPSRSLKQICQEQGVPQWARGHLPMVVADGHVVFAAVAGMNADLPDKDGDERIALGFYRSDASAGFGWPL